MRRLGLPKTARVQSGDVPENGKICPSKPRAAFSHSREEGRRLLRKRQYVAASSHVTETTGCVGAEKPVFWEAGMVWQAPALTQTA